MADIWTTFQEFVISNKNIIELIIIFIASFVILSIILRAVRKKLLKKVKSKRQVSNVTIFIGLLKFAFGLILLLIIVFSYSDSWGELGFVAGLLTVAFGLALQKPISGIFAWLIIVSRKPFRIGDRVNLTGINGDITDITLSHIMLDEVGGTIDGEESSGRTIIVPTSVIFEQDVINYTERDEFILDEVTTTITYECNLENAENIMISSVEKIMIPLWIDFPKKAVKKPHIRLNFKDSGINVTVRYITIATQRNKISTDIRREIHKLIISAEDVEFAYPHAEVLLKEKKA